MMILLGLLYTYLIVEIITSIHNRTYFQVWIKINEKLFKKKWRIAENETHWVIQYRYALTTWLVEDFFHKNHRSLDKIKEMYLEYKSEIHRELRLNKLKKVNIIEDSKLWEEMNNEE